MVSTTGRNHRTVHDDDDDDDFDEIASPAILKEKAIMLLSGPINVGHLALAGQLLAYHYDDSFKEPITLLINSPGGSCDVGWAIIDVMNFIRLPIHTVAIGASASMAADIFANGDKRTIGEHGSLMIHSHSNMVAGTHSQLISAMKGDQMEMDRRRHHYLNNSICTTLDEVQSTFFSKDDLYLTPADCVKLGIADEIALSNKKDKREAFRAQQRAVGRVSESDKRSRLQSGPDKRPVKSPRKRN